MTGLFYIDRVPFLPVVDTVRFRYILLMGLIAASSGSRISSSRSASHEVIAEGSVPSFSEEVHLADQYKLPRPYLMAALILYAESDQYLPTLVVEASIGGSPFFQISRVTPIQRLTTVPLDGFYSAYRMRLIPPPGQTSPRIYYKFMGISGS